MLHRTHFITELRELPHEDGWLRAEGTGRACLVCSCGLNTGWIPRRKADQLRRQHGTPLIALTQQERPSRSSSTSPAPARRF